VLSWSRSTAHHAVQWSVAARRTHRSVDVGFRLADRDKRVAAGVLAGGVAYRMFFWMLSVSVLSTGALGVVDGAWLDETLRELGLRPTAVDAIAQLLQGSDDAQWWLILVGGWLVLWTGYLGAKALVLVHAAVWGVPAPQAHKQWVMSLVFSGTAVAFIVSMSVADSIQARGGGVGFVAFLVSTSIPCALWLAVSSRLPHAAGGWKHLVPGALLVGTGAQAVQQLATWFLAPKLASATQLYGLLGIVATALFGLYILARLIIAAATLNASVGEQRSAAARHPDAPTRP
jgi:uncharacterized BrkB/YihY/UPF0761 family membrane protein